MKFLLILLITFGFARSGNAQAGKFYMWYNGDQDKHIPVMLLSIDSPGLEKDTIATYQYLISKPQFDSLAKFLFNESLASDSIRRLTDVVSFDFTLTAKSSYYVFFTQKLSALKRRFIGIVEILKNHPDCEAIEAYSRGIMSSMRFKKGFPL